jgi:hypothetical protein
MSLRVEGLPLGQSRDTAPNGATADGWATRLAKLIPAEALGAYGAATGLLPTTIDHTLRLVLLIVIAVLCIGILIAVRVKSTSLGTGSPQVVGIIISAISFVIWISTLGSNSPIPWPESVAFIPTIVALLWVTAVGILYRGDTGQS